MSDSLFSSSWYRVAEVRPRLRSHAVIHRHIYRGQVWYVLQDRSSGRFHRFSPVANLVIGLMDGRRKLREIWDIACTRLGDDAPTQDDVINILASLHRADVLQTDMPPDIEEIHERHVKQRRMKLKQYVQNPLSLRFPLFDPERLLVKMDPVTRHLFSPIGAVLWLVVVGWALVLAGSHWDELTKDVTDRILSTQNLILMGLVFPVAKLIHELGHAAAVKSRGGEVHELGVMVLVLMPVPYVDASASLAFRGKFDRMLVGAAGMLSELFLAAIAMFVWANVETGTVSAIAYNVMIIAGVSTLVFNANPLLRFDGYYILSDWLEIPNLGQRANSYVSYLTRRHMLRVKSATPPPEIAPGERPWLASFAVGSFIYRIIVTISIALLVAEQYFIIGVLLAMWSLYGMFIQPAAKRIGYLFGSDELQGKRARSLATVGIVLSILLVVLVWVPAPSWTRTEGVAVAPPNAQVRAAVDGFVQKVVATANGPVKRGEVLLLTEDPELVAKVGVYEAQLKEQMARYSAAHDDRVQLNMIREEIVHIEARLESAKRRAEELVVRSPGDGIFVIMQPGDQPGRFVRRGELLAYVLDYAKVAVQVVVPQGDVDLVRKMTRRVELRTVERIPDLISADVRRVVPAATNQLPNLALSSQGGGDVVLDPQAGGDSKNADARSASSLFIFELEVPPSARLFTLGSRIYARFEREPEPLGVQWYRSVRRVLLKRFNV